jgi:spermidine synthase
MSFTLALLAVALGGFLALSCEILWFRVYSFVTGATASGFGVVLGAYLLGLALGSWWVRQVCDDDAVLDPKRRRLPALLALSANFAAFLLIPFVGWEVRVANYAWSLPAVALVAGLLGALLPLISHFGIAPDARAGTRLSYLYLANIVGSAAGSLLTGFVLLDHLSLQQVAVLLAVLGAGLAILLLVGQPLPAKLRNPWLAASIALGIAAPLLAGPLYDGIYESLQFKGKYTGERFAHVIETRSGVITVTQDGAIFGGGMYDGVFSTSLVHDRNRLIRAYALPALHPNPRQVLMIGLASGSWAQVLAHAPGVDKLTIVEINPGYLELIRRFTMVRSLLENPKVEVVIDDGRRWLTSHPERKFDAVVQNTTWHWRAQMTGLLSREYLEIVRAHLLPGGLFLYNTTDAVHAQKAACQAFPHGIRFQNMMALREVPVQFDAARWNEALRAWRIDGQPVFDLSQPEDQKRLAEVLHDADPSAIGGVEAHVEPCASILARSLKDPALTDDNMVVEFSRKWWQQP